MKDKKKKVMSLAVKPEHQEELKKISMLRGESVSGYIGSLIEQAIKLNPNDDPLVIGKPADQEVTPVLVPVIENVKPIILKIPMELQSNAEALEKWIVAQAAAIVKKFCHKD